MDGLDLLIGRHFSYYGDERKAHIMEIAKAVVDQSNGQMAPIDLSNQLQRVCLCAFLRPIYNVLEVYISDKKGYNHVRTNQWEDYVRGLWYDLHLHLMEHGFCIKHVQEFIEAEVGKKNSKI